MAPVDAEPVTVVASLLARAIRPHSSTEAIAAALSVIVVVKACRRPIDDSWVLMLVFFSVSRLIGLRSTAIRLAMMASASRPEPTPNEVMVGMRFLGDQFRVSAVAGRA